MQTIFFPIAKSEALAGGFNWIDISDTPSPHASKFPDDIRTVNDEIASQTFICEKTGKKFRYTKAELDFYKIHSIPLPHVAPLERLRFASDFLSCHDPFTTSCNQCYTPLISYLDKSRAILCEQCFRQNYFA